MNKELFAGMSEHMAEFGYTLIGKALHDATFDEFEGIGIHGCSLVIAAHASEILIKSAIAAKNPSLIFKETNAKNQEELFENSYTIKYSELPKILCKSTGYQIANQAYFLEFGKIRNHIVHLGMKKNKAYGVETIRFSVEIIDPLIKHFWNASVFFAASAFYEEIPPYLIEQCVYHNFNFKIPKELEVGTDLFTDISINLNNHRYD